MIGAAMTESVNLHGAPPLEENNHTPEPVLVDGCEHVTVEYNTQFSGSRTRGGKTKSKFADLLTFGPYKEHTHTCILLHDRGNIATLFADEFLESRASDDRTLTEIFPSIKWVLPTSKLRMSVLYKRELSQWFDMWGQWTPRERKELQTAGLVESVTYLDQVVKHETSFVPYERIILGGFGQGAAIAAHSLIYNGKQLGGFIGISSWLPFRDEIIHGPKFQVGRTAETPVFLSHSKDDIIVPIVNGMEMCEALEYLGLKVIWKTYENENHHAAIEREHVDDIVAFLEKVLGSM